MEHFNNVCGTYVKRMWDVCETYVERRWDEFLFGIQWAFNGNPKIIRWLFDEHCE